MTEEGHNSDKAENIDGVLSRHLCILSSLLRSSLVGGSLLRSGVVRRSLVFKSRQKGKPGKLSQVKGSLPWLSGQSHQQEQQQEHGQGQEQEQEQQRERELVRQLGQALHQNRPRR